MRTQVGIIGAGPAGLFLAHLLDRAGIANVILEARSRAYVEARVRAGVLEPGTVEIMTQLGLDARMRRECMIDRVLDFRFDGRAVRVPLEGLTGQHVTIYGQQEVVKDLIAARIAAGGEIHFEASVTALEGIDGTSPVIRYTQNGAEKTVECDVIAGCDGFHGVSRPAIPQSALTIYDIEFPFAWFGIISRSPPIAEMTYASHSRGFALCSRRSPQVSRHYVQVPSNEDIEKWSDAQFWDELHTRMDDSGVGEIQEGEIVQRDIAQLRAFVAAPMRYGRLFLVGDAAHIVPPTGAKGLNLAVADARVLARGLEEFYRTGTTERLDRYSDVALRRVWKAVRYSTYMTRLLHRFDGRTPFDRQLQITELDYISGSKAAQTSMAENYVGLPFEDK
jgi:p-hydroxybenzoate 3-monooxygenase